MRLTDERRDGMARHIGLAKHLAGSFARWWPGREDDFFEVAYISLCEAACEMDPEDRKFGAHAARRIRCDLKDLQDYLAVRNREKIGIDSEPAGPGDLESVEDRDFADWVLGRISCKGRDLCGLVWKNGLTITEAARELGISRASGWATYERCVLDLIRQRACIRQAMGVPS